MKKCTGQSSAQQNINASTSVIQFVDWSETMKLEIKEETEIEDEMNPLDFMSTEFCDDVVENDEISSESELDAESIDCKESNSKSNKKYKRLKIYKILCLLKIIIKDESFAVKMEGTLFYVSYL